MICVKKMRMKRGFGRSFVDWSVGWRGRESGERRAEETGRGVSFSSFYM